MGLFGQTAWPSRTASQLHHLLGCRMPQTVRLCLHRWMIRVICIWEKSSMPFEPVCTLSSLNAGGLTYQQG
jgi:hypothetical protein